MGNVDRLPHKPGDKRVFKIGDFVCTRVLVEMQYENSEESAKSGAWKRRAVRIPQENEVWGQIIGACRRYEGTLYPASGGDGGWFGEEPPDPEQAYLAPSKTITLWEIRQGYLNKPVLAFAEDIKPAIGVLCGSVPWSHQNQPPYDRRVRLELSKAAKTQKRETNGRFVKEAT